MNISILERVSCLRLLEGMPLFTGLYTGEVYAGKVKLPGVHQRLLRSGVTIIRAAYLCGEGLCVSAGEDGRIFVRFVGTDDTCCLCIDDHTDSVESLKLLVDMTGTRTATVVSASTDGTVRGWKIGITATIVAGKPMSSIAIVPLFTISHKSRSATAINMKLLNISPSSKTVTIALPYSTRDDGRCDIIKMWSANVVTGDVHALPSLTSQVRSRRASSMLPRFRGSRRFSRGIKWTAPVVETVTAISVVCDTDGVRSILVVGYSTGVVRLWDTRTSCTVTDPFVLDKVVTVIKKGGASLNSPGSTFMVSGSACGTVDCWEIDSQFKIKQVESLGTHSSTEFRHGMSAVTSIATGLLETTGYTSIVTGSENGSIKVWGLNKSTPVTEGSPVRMLSIYTRSILCIK